MTATSGRKGRRLGVDIKPGTVRQARMEAGLSLGKVANGAVSRTAIYFVETGKAKPSMETLRLIAERTGRPLDFFLAQPSTIEPRSSPRTTAIELLLATGDLEGAIVKGQALLDQNPDSETGAWTRHLVAQAYLRLGRPTEGRRLAAAARAHFERTGDRLMIAECLGHEASAAYLMQDPVAVGLAQRALELCRSLKPIPRMTESRLHFILGSAHATNHEWPAAIDCYEQALTVGGVVQDLRRLSLIYSGLSLGYSETARLDQAVHYARRALTLHETLNDRQSLARSENNLGVLQIKRGDLADAEVHLHRALQFLDADSIDAGRADMLLSLSELAHARSNLNEAGRLAAQALELAQRLGEQASAAEAHMWLGRFAEDRSDPARADAEFTSAWSLLDALGSGERLSRCHALYAEILERRGDLVTANHHLRLAIKLVSPVRLSLSMQPARIATA